MAVEMIGAEVEHRRRIEAQACDSLQHVGGHFQHVDAVVRQQRQRQRRRAEIAARRRPAARQPPGYAPAAPSSVDLPLVPVMPAKRAAEPAAAHRAIQQLGIATGSARRRRCARAAIGCGLGRRCGMPGDSTSARQPGHLRLGAHRSLRRWPPRAPPADRPRPPHPRPSRAARARRAGRCGRGRPPRNARPRRCREGKLIVSSTSPGRPRPESSAMIQKRMTMVGSDQPFFSK